MSVFSSSIYIESGKKEKKKTHEEEELSSSLNPQIQFAIAAGMNPNCFGDDGFRVEKSYKRRRGAEKLKCDRQQQQQQEEEEEEEEEDIISNLPDSLLHHIFSFLDIKQAIHTCVLSKRWRYFWVSIPTLNFVYESIKDSKKPPLQKFTDFVDRVLMLRDNCTIHRFAITSGPASQGNTSAPITSNLDTWVLIAVLRNVEELSLEVTSNTKYRLPHCLFTCKSLTKLEIHNHGFGLDISSDFPDKISLPRLKTLYLDSVYFRDKCLSDRIIPNCPSLESLILHGCRLDGKTFDICSLKLKELVVRKCSPFNIWFNLNVPNLISFHYHDFAESSTFGCEKKYKHFLHLVHILKQLHNVEDLKLSAPDLEFLTSARHLLGSLSEFCNLRCLMLEDICISKDFNQAVSYLLKLFPNLRTLGVTTRGIDCIFHSGCWETGFSSDSNCVMMNHLTVFELRDVKGRDRELNFIEVLLKNAKVLERLVIDFIPYFSLSSETKESCFIFMEKVLALPRSSLSSTILFK